METQEKRFRLVVLGSGKVGKTAIIQRYLHGTFDKKYRETVEDLYLKDFNLQGMKISLEILDTNFDYPDMRKVAIASANAFMLVFAVNDVPSFKQIFEATVQAWTQRLNSNVSYVESSAMMNRNIIKIFQKFLEQSGLSDEKIVSI
ncbi:unnamed protein product [Thelazia callipaeda]|uniref:Ras family protein n=1 Tax=Thelazia callipaeda TaxID=103827 RepID=A0A0N5CUQ7_THECL|nr:unnamed protein product [Thelazia callipaeda]